MSPIVTTVPAYRHRQIGTPMIVVMLLLAAGLGPALLLYRAVGVPALILALTAAACALFGTLTVIVDDRAIEARFGIGLIRRRFALDTVQEVGCVRNPWYYGWGIRYYPGGTLYNVAGLSAVELRLSDGGCVRIGTDEPDVLVAAIEQRRHAAGLPSPGRAAPARRSQAPRLVAALVALACVTLVVVGWLETRPPVVSVSADTVRIGSTLYGVSIPRQDLGRITLEPALPRVVARTNGFALGRTLRGHFRVEGLGAGELFVDRDRPPFVLVRTRRQRFVIVNFADPARTRAVYDLLRALGSGTTRSAQDRS